MVSHPDLDDLIWLFEGEPTPDFPDGRVPGGVVDWRKDWPYTTVTFTLVRPTFTLGFTISPSYEHVRMIVQADGDEIVDFDLRHIIEVSVERGREREALRLVSRDDNVGVLHVTTRPSFSLRWSVGKDR